MWFCSSLPKDEGGLRFEVPDSVAAGLRKNPGGAVILGLRPEHLWVGNTPDEHPPPGWTAATATLQSAEFVGAESHLALCCGAAVLRARVAGWRSVEPGARLQLAFDPRRAHCFDPQTTRRL